jgi:hypothetical protein
MGSSPITPYALRFTRPWSISVPLPFIACPSVYSRVDKLRHSGTINRDFMQEIPAGSFRTRGKANFDAFAKTHKMAKQKFRPTRLGGFSGAKAYIVYVEVLKKRRNAVGRTFCDAINIHS